MTSLFYNADHPIEILSSLVIKRSRVNGFNRGVSMSSRFLTLPHGCFTFVFHPERVWYKQFREVKYGLPGPTDSFNLPLDFEGEYEWCSLKDVYFSLDDIEKIVFRRNSPAQRIHPIKSVRNYKKLCEIFPRVEEMVVFR